MKKVNIQRLVFEQMISFDKEAGISSLIYSQSQRKSLLSIPPHLMAKRTQPTTVCWVWPTVPLIMKLYRTIRATCSSALLTTKPRRATTIVFTTNSSSFSRIPNNSFWTEKEEQNSPNIIRERSKISRGSTPTVRTLYQGNQRISKRTSRLKRKRF